MKYRIYEDFFKDVEKKLNRIGRKCARHGNPFLFEVIGNEIEEREITEVIDGRIVKRKAYYKFVIVEVEGTAKINDYECVAVLENHTHGNVIRRINTEIEIPQRFQHTDNFCEHCNSKRRRNELYIIHNVKTGEFKQVGSNCLMLYANGLNAEYVTGYIDGITQLEEFDGFIGGGGKSYIPVEEVLSYATEIINKMGYFNSNSDCPTKWFVGRMLNGRDTFNEKIDSINEELRDGHFNIRFDKNDFYKDETENIVEKIIEYYLSLDNTNEFINNVQVILKDKFVEYHNIGFLCYLPCGYFKHIEQEIKRAEQKLVNEKSEYFGEVGKRYKDELVYNGSIVTSFDTMYGYMYIYKFVLESGNILIWKSCNFYCENDLKKCDKITFTVKKHNDYKGTKQTEVTRCKLNIKED